MKHEERYYETIDQRFLGDERFIEGQIGHHRNSPPVHIQGDSKGPHGHFGRPILTRNCTYLTGNRIQTSIE